MLSTVSSSVQMLHGALPPYKWSWDGSVNHVVWFKSTANVCMRARMWQLHLLRVISLNRWSMGLLEVTYSAKRFALRMWMRRMISSGDIERALFEDASSFGFIFPNSQRSPLNGVVTFSTPPSFPRVSPTWLVRQAGQWVGVPRPAISHIPLSMPCN